MSTIRLRKFPSISSLLSFYLKWVLSFVRCFFLNLFFTKNLHLFSSKPNALTWLHLNSNQLHQTLDLFIYNYQYNRYISKICFFSLRVNCIKLTFPEDTFNKYIPQQTWAHKPLKILSNLQWCWSGNFFISGISYHQNRTTWEYWHWSYSFYFLNC